MHDRHVVVLFTELSLAGSTGSHPLNRGTVLQGIPLAVKALHQLNNQDSSRRGIPRLVVAGGFNKRLAENREHYEEIRQLVVDLGLQQQVCKTSVSLYALQTPPLTIL